MTRGEILQQKLSEVPEDVFDDLFDTLNWAKTTLTNYEGSGHMFQLTAKGDKICCSFAKPSWPGDHTGNYEYDASQAIITAVCEYLVGY
jgi:hypothetical protein